MYKWSYLWHRFQLCIKESGALMSTFRGHCKFAKKKMLTEELWRTRRGSRWRSGDDSDGGRRRRGAKVKSHSCCLKYLRGISSVAKDNATFLGANSLSVLLVSESDWRRRSTFIGCFYICDSFKYVHGPQKMNLSSVDFIFVTLSELLSVMSE